MRMFINAGCPVEVEGELTAGATVNVRMTRRYAVDCSVVCVLDDIAVVTLPNGDAATLYPHPELV